MVLGAAVLAEPAYISTGARWPLCAASRPHPPAVLARRAECLRRGIGRWALSSLLLSLLVGLAGSGCRDAALSVPGFGDTSSVRVGPEGGEFQLGELTLSVPPGAVGEVVGLTLSRMPTPEVEGFSGPWFEIGPTGFRFLRPVRVHVAYRSRSKRGQDVIMTRVGGQFGPVSGSQQDSSGTWAMTRHLSPFGVGQVEAPFAEVDGDVVEHGGIRATAAGSSGLWFRTADSRLHLAAGAPPRGDVWLDGLAQGERWFLYRDDFDREAQVVEVGSSGTVSFSPEGATHFYLHRRPSTRVIRDACSCKGGELTNGGCQIPTETPPAHFAGSTCYLDANVGEAIELTDGITLNCQGYEVRGPFSPESAVGITWTGPTRANVEHCSVRGFEFGLALADTAAGRPGGQVTSLSTDGAIELRGAYQMRLDNLDAAGTPINKANRVAVLIVQSREIGIGGSALNVSPPSDPRFASANIWIDSSEACLVKDSNLTGDAYGIVMSYRDAPGRWLTVQETELTGLSRGGVLVKGDWTSLPLEERPAAWWSDLYDNDLVFSAYEWISESGPLELSRYGLGNWWGRGFTPAGDFVAGPLFVAGVDTNRGDAVDSHPYCRKSGWATSAEPGPCSCNKVPIAECVNVPPAPVPALVVDPGSGTVDTSFKLDASQSRSRAVAQELRFRFDTDGDGVWDTAFGSTAGLAGVRYRSAGTYAPVVEVEDLTYSSFARATAQPVTVALSPPVIQTVAPSSLPRHSQYQSPVDLVVTGSGLAEGTGVDLGGIPLAVAWRDDTAGGLTRIGIRVDGGVLPDVGSVTLTLTNTDLSTGATASTSRVVPVRRAQPAIVQTDPAGLPSANKALTMTVTGGYFYPGVTRVAFEAAHAAGGVPEVFEMTNFSIDADEEHLTVAVPELLFDDSYGAGSVLYFLADNFASNNHETWARHQLIFEAAPRVPAIEMVRDIRLLSEEWQFDADTTNDPVKLLVNVTDPESGMQLLVKSFHTGDSQVFEMIRIYGVANEQAECTRHGGVRLLDLFDGMVVVRAAYGGSRAWSHALPVWPQYPSPGVTTVTPNALRARPNTAAIGPQYVTVVGDNLFTDTRARVIRGGIVAGATVVSRTVPSELVVEIPGWATASFTPTPWGGPMDQILATANITIELSTDSEPLAPDAPPANPFAVSRVPRDVIYLGEHGERCDRCMPPFGDDEDAQIEGAHLTDVLDNTRHHNLGASVYSWWDDGGELQTRILWWSHARPQCYAMAHTVAAGYATMPTSRDAYFPDPTSSLDIEGLTAGTARRYEWNLNTHAAFVADLPGPLEPGQIHAYQVYCTEGTSGDWSDWETVASADAYFRTPDRPQTRRQSATQFAVVSDVAWCSQHQHDGDWIGFKCDSDIPTSAHKHKLNQWRVANTLQHYFYRGAVDFVLGAGDISDSYNDVWTYYGRVFPFFAPVMAGVPFFPIHGNHDIGLDKPGYDMNSEKFFNVFTMPTHDPRYHAYLCNPSYSSQFYGFSHGQVSVAAFDYPEDRTDVRELGFSWLQKTCLEPTYEAPGQWRWIRDTLPSLAARSPWVFGMMHNQFQNDCYSRPEFCGLLGLGAEIYPGSRDPSGGIDILVSGHSGEHANNKVRAADGGSIPASGRSYAPEWSQFSGTCKGDYGFANGACVMDDGFMHYTVTPERVVARRVDIGTGVDESESGDPNVNYMPRGYVTGCWVVEKEVFPAQGWNGDPAAVFDPARDCWPDLLDPRRFQEALGDKTLEPFALNSYAVGLEGLLPGLDDRTRFPSQPGRAFLTPCGTIGDTFPMERFAGDLDDPLHDFPLETSCTECSCVGDVCNRVKRYVVRNRTAPGTTDPWAVETFIPELDALCEVLP
ncbi:MAG: metallophosphoesterase [Deltaproteobacteria bacterium]|nr:metallophosphoesterase [Deltaproteobacteria bacterium]